MTGSPITLMKKLGKINDCYYTWHNFLNQYHVQHVYEIVSYIEQKDPQALITLQWKLLNWIPSPYLLHPSPTFLNVVLFFPYKIFRKKIKNMLHWRHTTKNTKKEWLWGYLRRFCLFCQILLPKDHKKQNNMTNSIYLQDLVLWNFLQSPIGPKYYLSFL